MTKETDHSFHLTDTIYPPQGVLQLAASPNLSLWGFNILSHQGLGSCCKTKPAFHTLQGRVNKST